MTLLINNIPIVITAYSCKLCGKLHRKSSKLFEEHFYNNFNKDDKRYIKPDKDGEK